MGLPNISPKPCFPVCGVHQGQSPLAQESRPASWRGLEALLTPAPSGGSAAQPTPASSRAANSFKTRSQAQPARCQPHRTNFFPSSSKSSAAFSCKSQHEVSNAPGCCQGKPPQGAGPGSSQVHTSRRDGERRFLRVSLAGALPRPVIAPLTHLPTAPTPPVPGQSCDTWPPVPSVAEHDGLSRSSTGHSQPKAGEKQGGGSELHTGGATVCESVRRTWSLDTHCADFPGESEAANDSFLSAPSPLLSFQRNPVLGQ